MHDYVARLGHDLAFSREGIVLFELNGINSGNSGLIELEHSKNFQNEGIYGIRTRSEEYTSILPRIEGNNLLVIRQDLVYPQNVLIKHRSVDIYGLLTYFSEKGLLDSVKDGDVICDSYDVSPEGELLFVSGDAALNSEIYLNDIGLLITGEPFKLSSNLVCYLGEHKIMNPPKIEEICNNKVLCSTLLKKTDVSTYIPDFAWSKGVLNLSVIEKAAEYLDRDKIVVKPASEKQGMGVKIFSRNDPVTSMKKVLKDLYAELKFFGIPADLTWIFQPFYEPCDEFYHAARVITIGDNYVHGYMRYGVEASRDDTMVRINNNGIINYSLGANIRPLSEDESELLKNASIKISRAFFNACRNTNIDDVRLAARKYELKE